MKLSSISRYFANLGLGRSARKPKRGTRRPVEKPTLEFLEDRTLLSTTPAPVVTNPNTSPYILAPSFTASGFDPQVVMDPTNSQNLVEVNTTGTKLVGNFSTDGGQSWNTFNFAGTFNAGGTLSPGVVLDPTTFQPEFSYPDVTSPSVTFDRNGNFYVVSNNFNVAAQALASSAADLANGTGVTGASGAIVFDKFNFASVAAFSNNAETIKNTILYQWNYQDPAYNPTIAIDTNLPATAVSGPSFIDPTTGATQTDTMAVSIDPTTGGVVPEGTANAVPKGIYVGWNNNFTEPQFRGGTPPAVSRVMIAASGDGGLNFTTNQYADIAGSGVIPATGINKGIGAGVGDAPAFLFTQGTTVPANTTSITFTTAPTSAAAGQLSGTITIQVKDAAGVAVPGAVVDLTSSSATGAFYTTAKVPLFTTPSGIPYVITDVNGDASFLYEDATAGTPTITAADAAATSLFVQQTETVTAGVADVISFTTAAKTVTAGLQSSAVTIQVNDGNGNPIANKLVDLSSTFASGTFFTTAGVALPTTAAGVPYVFTNASGQASFLYEDTTVGTPTLKAVDAANPNVNGTQTETITASTVASILFLTGPMTVTAGQQTATITTLVRNGANTAVAGEVVLLTSSSATGTFYSSTGAALPTTTGGTPYVVSNALGQAAFRYADTANGFPILKVADAGSAVFAQQGETVNTGVATTVTFTTLAQTLNAGQESSTITINVASNVPNPVPNEVVKLTSSSGTGTFFTTAGVALPKTSAGVPYVVTDASGNASFLYVDTAVGAPTLTAADSANTLISGTQTETVNAGVANTIGFTSGPTTALAGQESSTITVQVKDAGNAVVPNEVVLLTSSTGTGTFYTTAGVLLPTTAGGVPFVITDATGSASFLYVDTTASTPTLTATDSANALVFGMQTETVTAGAGITFTSGPVTVSAGKQSTAISIHFTDATNTGVPNHIVDLSSSSLGGTFYNSTTGAALPKTTIGGLPYVITDVNGNASFLYVDTNVGTPTLTATDAATNSVSRTQKETITAPAASTITFTTAPVTVNAGHQSTAITIQVKNAANAVIPGEVVDLRSNSGSGTFYNSVTGVALPTTTNGTPYVITNASGQASFLYLDTRANNPTLTASDSANGVFGTQQETINADEAATITFTTPPTTGAPGQELGPITVQVKNGANAVIPGQLLNLSTDSTTGTFYDANGAVITTVLTNGAGNASFFYVDLVPSAPTLTVTDAATPTLFVTQKETITGVGVPTVPGGQLNVLYSTITAGAVKVQQSQPDGGVSTNDVAAAVTFNSTLQNTNDGSNRIQDGNPAGFANETVFVVGNGTNGNGGISSTDFQMQVTIPGGTLLPPTGTIVTIDAGTANAEQVQVVSVAGNIWGITTAGGAARTAANARNHANGAPVTYQVKTSAASSQTTDFPLTVTAASFPKDFTTIDDLEVTIGMVHPHMDQVSIVLIPPPGSGLANITLLANFENTDTTTNPGQGEPDNPNMGVLANPTVRPLGSGGEVNTVGTVFDSDAPRFINSENDNTSMFPWIGHFKPEFGSLDEVDGLTAAQVAGQWTLAVTDFVFDNTNPPPEQNMTLFSMHFTSLISTTGFGAGADTTSGGGGPGGATGDPAYSEHGAFQNARVGALTSSPSNVYPNNLGGPTNFASGVPGAGPGFAYAVDNTLGSFSPFAGRIYIAYTTGTAIKVAHSDNDAVVFGAGVQVNDDSVTDNFSEGNRPEFMPAIAIDPVTGTVVITYYDGRWDAATSRVGNSVSYSVDGGDDWSASASMNLEQTATDEVTGNTANISPVVGNTTMAGQFGFGDRSSVMVYDGDVVPFFGSNLNAAGDTVMTADVSIPTGPRVVTGDMGPVATDFNYTPTVYADSSNTVATYVPITYNNVFAADGTRGLSQFVVTFDRPIDVSSFTPNEIQVYFRDPEGDPAVQIAVKSIQALDNTTQFGPELVGLVNGVFTLATQFLITLVAPQFNVGTYSYAVGLSQTAVGFNQTETWTLASPLVAGTPGTSTTLTVTAGGPVAPTTPFTISIDNERLSVTNVSGTTWTVTRGVDGTTAAMHLAGVKVTTIPISDDIRSVPTGIALQHQGPTEATAGQNLGATVLLGTYMNQGQDALTNVNPAAGIPTTTPIESSDTPVTIPGTGALVADTININDPYQQVRQDYYDPIQIQVDIGTLKWSLAAPLANGTAGTSTTLTVSAGGPTAPTPGFDITIDQEELTVTAVNGNVWTVTRGVNGTTSSHNTFAPIFFADPVFLTVSLVSADGTTVSLGTHLFTPTNGLATITFADYNPTGALGVVTPPAPLFAALRNEGVSGNWKLQLSNGSGTTFFLNDWFLKVPRTTNAFAVPNPVTGMPFNFPYSDNTLPLIVPGPHVVSTAVVSTGTYNTVSTYSTVGSTQNNVSLNLAPGATTTTNQLLLPVTNTVNVVNTSDAAASSNAFQIQQNGTNHIEVHMDLALNAAENLTIKLVAQDGNTVTLLSNATVTPTGGIASYTFDDFAPIPSTTFTSPNSATTAPVTPLAALINDNTSGDWQLVITNNGAAAAPLTVADWALQLPHTTGDNEVLNGTATGLLVTFDRDIDPTTFTPADIVQMLSPIGTPIGGSPVVNPANFTVTADPAGTPSQLARRVFEITYPTEGLNGTYSLTLAPTITDMITDTHGNAIDTNLNAGIDVLQGTNATNTVTSFLFQGTNGNLNLAIPAGQTVTSVIPISQAFKILQDQGEAWSLASNLGVGDPTLKVMSNTSNTNMQPPATPFTVTIGGEELTITAVKGTTWTIGQRGVNGTTVATHNAGDAVFTTGHHIQVTVNITAAAGSNFQSSDLQAQLIAPDGTVIQLFTNVGAGLGTTQGFQSTTFDDFSTTPIQNGTPPYSNLTGTYDPQQPLSVLIGKSTTGVGPWQLRITNTATNGDTAALQDWILSLPHATPDTNLGETQADQISTSFRIFTQDPTNPLTQQQWTAVGPAADNNGANSGPVNAIAVDPSDPSGNTVYVAAASGGLWKTTNFLTNNPLGPTYIPLTNLGPNGSLNISSIAVFALNNNPEDSYIYAITGNPNNVAIPGNPGSPLTVNASGNIVGNPVDLTAGIGILRSNDGGQTWEILDSSHNFYDPANDGSGGVGNATLDDQPLAEDAVGANQRDHFFVGLVGYKVTVDPTPLPNGNLVVYAAFSSGPNNPNGGLYRSVDGGADWQLAPAPDAATGKTDLFGGTATPIKTGDATDVVLAAGSGDANHNLQQLYAAFQRDGVYGTTSATSATSLSQLTGNTSGQLPSLQNVDFGFRDPQTVTIANTPSPNGANGRIVLAAPSLTSSPLENSFYEGWLYAAVANAGDSSLVGLYVTKDFGANWTLIQLPEVSPPPPFVPVQPIYGTNNTSASPTRLRNNTLLDPNGQQVGGLNDQIAGIAYLSLTVDPTNPNIVYLGGAGYNLLRIDITNLADAYAAVPYTNIAPDGGTTQFSTADIGPATLEPPPPGGPGPGPGAPFGVFDTLTPNLPLTTPATYPLEQGPSGSTGFYNLLRDPANPFPGATPSSTVQLKNIITIQNQGTGVLWGELGNLTNSLGVGILGNMPDPITGNASATLTNSIDIRALVAIRDPLTGETRLLIGNDNGVFTGADRTSTQLQDNVGTAQEVIGSRNGNIQIADMTDSASQPSSLAANIAGALFYGSSQFDNGFPQSAPDILDTGNLNWTGLNTYPSTNAPSYFGNGTGVATDQTGTGQLYQTRWAEILGNGINQAPRPYTDFFLVTPPQGALTGRTFGTIPNDQGQWPSQGASRFAVNPVDPTGIVMSSQTGVVYRTYGPVNNGGTGITWHPIGNFTASYGDAMAFGAPNPKVDSNNDDFIYDGTVAGQVWVTFNGGTTAWINITANLDGSAVEQIVTDPNQGSHDLFAITQRGVYYMADSNSQVDFGTAPTWVNLTGNLFTLERSLFDNPHNPNDLAVTLHDLTSLAVDWRFAVPNNDAAITNNGVKVPFLPVLYVGGDGGVFRMLPNSVGGTTWTYFPDVTSSWSLAAALPAAASGSTTTLTVNTGGSADPSPGTIIQIGSELLTVTSTGTNNGTTWTVTRGVGGTTAAAHAINSAVTHTGDSAVENGGNLPNVEVTSLQVVTGNINPVNGFPNESTGYNLLLASTYGQGDFAIRMDNSSIQQYAISPPTLSFAGPSVTNVAPVPATGGTVLTGATVTFGTAIPVDPQTAEKTSDYMVFDPNGVQVAVASVTDVTPPPTGGANPHNIYQLTFLHPQTLFGTYTVKVSGASDNAGDLMTPYTGTFSFPYSPAEVAASFPTYGIYGFGASTGFQQINGNTATLLAVNANGDVAAALSNNGGLWLYTQSTQTWKELSAASVSALAIDINRDVVSDLAGQGVFLYNGATGGFNHLSSFNATALAMDDAGDVFANFPNNGFATPGVNEYAAGATSWTAINGTQATLLAADGAGDLFINFVGYGVDKRFANGNTISLNGNQAALLAVDEGGDAAVVYQNASFPGIFEALAGATGFTHQLTAAATSELAIGGNGDVFGVLSDSNVYEFPGGMGGRQLTVPANSATLPGEDKAGDLFALVSGKGVSRYTNANGWQALPPIASPSILVEDAAGDVAGEFPNYGVYFYSVTSGAWRQVASNNASQLVIDAAGDVFALFSGYGIYRLAAGSTGPMQLFAANTTVTLLVADANGDLALNFANGGLYRYTASTNQFTAVNGNQATLLAIDSAGDIFANLSSFGVYRFPNGAGGQSLNGTTATQLTVDGAGDVFVEFKGLNGVYRSSAANPAAFQQIAQGNASLLTDDIFGDVFVDFPGYAYYRYTTPSGFQLLPGTEGKPTVLA